MSFSSASNRSVLSAVALASALAVGSGAAVAAPALQVGQTSVDNNATAQIASTGDPTAFSQIAHEQSAHDNRGQTTVLSFGAQRNRGLSLMALT